MNRIDLFAANDQHNGNPRHNNAMRLIRTFGYDNVRCFPEVVWYVKENHLEIKKEVNEYEEYEFKRLD